jgi:uncharacterized protein YihD (DUF1040 family)
MFRELTKREAMERLLRVWEASPNLRLGQLLKKTTEGVSIAYLFDDELVELMELDLRTAKRTKATPAAKTRN